MKHSLAAVLVLTLLWALLAAALSLPFLPGPLKVAAELARETAAGGILPHLGVSFLRVTAALVCAFVPALVLGLAAGLDRRADRLISPTAYLLFPVPKVALLPVIMLFLGLGNLSKIFLISFIVFFQLFLEIRDGATLVNRRYFDSLRSLGGSRKDILVHVVLPAVLPRVFSALRLSLGTAFAVLFLTETFATRFGIGWYIMDAWTRLDYARMYAGIMALSLAAILLFAALDLAQRKLCRWTRIGKD